ncbi:MULTISPECIES: hypothetical protein [unclassified Flavobacterium]|uniref:hypothetical protein n=1 Tax=unclassified Flavobacterium TaxID=196869 RepID=UPI0009671405|nr:MULTISPECIES: hypothetical protein [unclassified Flavobacterium]MBN9286213.1 hypothetical protein [Flavobacterium sp.]OJV67233.1 MAG: hypothetical protein BGO42_10935 [Flavobacterium sp. 40-81]
MSFYPFNNEERNHNQLPSGSKRNFKVSESASRSGNASSAITVSLVLFLIFCLKVDFAVNKTDIQSIVQIVAGLGGFALAVPLFLKDFESNSTFWRQFYITALTFMLATFIGLFAFLTMNNDLIKTGLNIWFVVPVCVSFAIPLIKYGKREMKQSLGLWVAGSYGCLFLSLIDSNGSLLVNIVMLFTIYGMYLMLGLMFAVLAELLMAGNETNNYDRKIKMVIEEVVLEHKGEAINENSLLELLKLKFQDNMEILSRNKIKMLVLEMDMETLPDQPKITITEDREYVIPRWRKEFDVILSEKAPNIIITDFYKQSILNSIDNLLKERTFGGYTDKIYNLLSRYTGLSAALLKENAVIPLLYKGMVVFKYGTVINTHTMLMKWADMMKFKDENKEELYLTTEEEKVIFGEIDRDRLAFAGETEWIEKEINREKLNLKSQDLKTDKAIKIRRMRPAK